MIEYHVNSEADALDRLLYLLRSHVKCVVLVICHVSELKRRCRDLLAHKLGGESRWLPQGSIVYHKDNLAFFAGVDINKLDISNVTDIIWYEPSFIGREWLQCDKCGSEIAGDHRWKRCSCGSHGHYEYRAA